MTNSMTNEFRIQQKHITHIVQMSSFQGDDEEAFLKLLASWA